MSVYNSWEKRLYASNRKKFKVMPTYKDRLITLNLINY